MKRLLTLIVVSILANAAAAQDKKDTTGRQPDSFRRLDDITIISGYNKFKKKKPKTSPAYR